MWGGMLAASSIRSQGDARKASGKTPVFAGGKGAGGKRSGHEGEEASLRFKGKYVLRAGQKEAPESPARFGQDT